VLGLWAGTGEQQVLALMAESRSNVGIGPSSPTSKRADHSNESARSLSHCLLLRRASVPGGVVNGPLLRIFGALVLVCLPCAIG
jgi:hypothetical protein